MGYCEVTNAYKIIVMGTIYIAACECGYESKRFSVGVGMAMQPYRAPIVCRNCGDLDVADFVKRKRKQEPQYDCKKCGQKKHFLCETDFHHPAGIAYQFNRSFPWEITEVRWDETALDEYPEVLYFCPACKKIRMKLYDAGVWD